MNLINEPVLSSQKFGNKIIIAAVVLAVVGVGVYVALTTVKNASNVSPAKIESQITPPLTNSSPSASENDNERIILISANGFAPTDFTIKVGTTVTFMNVDAVDHQVQSNPHPAHNLFPLLNLGLLRPNDKKSVEFKNAGVYTYHDHLNPKLTGSINVK